MDIRIIGVAITLGIAWGCGDGAHRNVKFKDHDSEVFVNTLDSLGYFSMTPADELDSSKKTIFRNFNDDRFFDGKLFHDSAYNVDYRFYTLDGEELYEEGGLKTYLEAVKRTFSKLRCPLEYKNETVKIKADSLIHTIELNGTRYEAYRGIYDDKSWGMAAFNFAEILNSELEKNSEEDRIYLISGGNDGRLVFLTEKMYSFIRRTIPKTEETPMEQTEWAEYYELKK